MKDLPDACGHGIVIISRSFLAKRWPKHELAGLVAREMAGTKTAILPIWHSIHHATLLAHSPTLADKVAGNSTQWNSRTRKNDPRRDPLVSRLSGICLRPASHSLPACYYRRLLMGKKSRNKRELRGQVEADSARASYIQMKADADPDGAKVIAGHPEADPHYGPDQGARYRRALLSGLFLKEKYPIAGEAVVGFVNDGTDDVYATQAGYEFKGQLTDIAISKPLLLDLQPRGPLTIQGIELALGISARPHSPEKCLSPACS